MRDFLTDRVLDQSIFLLALEFAVAISDPQARSSGGAISRLGLGLGLSAAALDAALDTIFANVVLVLAERLPKRRGMTLLHVAAPGGSAFVGRRVLDVRGR